MQDLKTAYNISRKNENCILTVTFWDKQKGIAINYTLEHTNHSKTRSDQRGISDQLICLAIDYGTIFYKQGFVFYAVRKKDLPKTMKHEIKTKLNNTVVVMAADNNQIITCYKNGNAVRHLKNKSKKIK